ncbi:hypothetical protein DLAC_04517 [Tieghemostelium lacteum]|uniref:Uncharacterized protein n=1 Tax=Tieghemostelium lacteum TaxID=361077 RepID=A0A151ZJP5_TIELA|nr:hypothetical protein DLAC_04517 [Tieghemostelium lacteum]|eukprot:KYQ94222.1 hypothetical protein DLAC_04517 [Tieghemostelium lacteum]
MYSLGKSDAKEKRLRYQEAIKEKRYINKKQLGCSQCMDDLYDFINKHPNDYPTVFLKGMNTSITRTDQIKRINDCRILAKEYCNDVEHWLAQYPEYSSKNKVTVKRYKTQCQQFAKLVKPLDNLYPTNK